MTYDYKTIKNGVIHSLFQYWQSQDIATQNDIEALEVFCDVHSIDIMTDLINNDAAKLFLAFRAGVKAGEKLEKTGQNTILKFLTSEETQNELAENSLSSLLFTEQDEENGLVVKNPETIINKIFEQLLGALEKRQNVTEGDNDYDY